MLELNKDPSLIIQQLRYIQNYLKHCVNSAEAYDFILTYNALVDFIKGKKQKKKYILDQNKWIDFLYNIAYENYEHILKNNFKKNLFYHQEIIGSYTFMKGLTDELQAKRDITKYKYHSFQPEEAKELLDAFFAQVDPSLKDLFFEISSARGIYYAPKEKYPCTVYNNLQGIPNIFLICSLFDVESLNDLVHELGHVKYDIEINKKAPHMALEYSYRSICQEIMPFYYEQRFLDFLISNNIHKQAAQVVLFNNFKWRQNELKKCEKLLNKDNPNYEKLFSNLSYIYGLFVANSLVFSPGMRLQFEDIQYNDFSANAFVKMGLTPERFQQDLTKYTKQYFK